MIDTQQLKNNKYLVGDYNKPNKHQGWFVGDFFEDNHLCKTRHVEVAYKEHAAGDLFKAHYHQEKVEIAIILEGKIRYIINNKDVLVIGRQYIFIAMEFVEKTKMLVIHSPSLPQDQVTVS